MHIKFRLIQFRSDQETFGSQVLPDQLNLSQTKKKKKNKNVKKETKTNK